MSSNALLLGMEVWFPEPNMTNCDLSGSPQSRHMLIMMVGYSFSSQLYCLPQCMAHGTEVMMANRQASVQVTIREY